jgi:hypothetical protein
MPLTTSRKADSVVIPIELAKAAVSISLWQ